MKKIAFDVDGTLIEKDNNGRDVPRYEVILMLKWFQEVAHRNVVIWSGSGIDYAMTWAEKLGLSGCEFRRKTQAEDIDIAFDDEVVELGKVNIKV